MQTLGGILAILGGLFAFVGCSHGGRSSEAAASTRPRPQVPAPAILPDAAHLAVSESPAVKAELKVAQPPADLNVLLLTIDSLRADMPWTGYPRDIAPTLTELEKQAVSYTHGYALSSYTAMSIGGLLGGRYPGEMKRDGYFFGSYRDNVMFPKLLHNAGIHTIAIHAHLYFRKGASGFEQGFETYEVVPGLAWDPTTDPNVTGEKSEQAAERILSDPANTNGRFFAWLHMMDPHDGYRSHPDVPAWGKKARDLYDNEVGYTDTQIRKLLDFVAKQPWGSRTAIIISADHGETFGEHGMYRHGFELWEPLVHVPWMFVLPGAKARHIDVARSHLDLAPTVLELFGLPAEPAFEGKSLVQELYGNREPAQEDVLVDLPRTSDSDRRRALIHGQYKIIAFGDDAYFQVFDLEADPEEKTSLQKTDPTTFQGMVQRYKAASKSLHDVGPFACRKLKGAPAGRAY